MKAFILAAGEGTRIREVTDGEIPKPMVYLGEGPLLEHTVNLLSETDPEEIIINLHHRGEKITDFFGEEFKGADIYYSWEDELLGTAGAVKNVEERLDERFVLLYGDILTDLDLDKLIEYHESKGSDITMMVYREDEENLKDASIVLMDEDKRVERFIEKPNSQEIEQVNGRNYWTNAAIFVVEPGVVDFIPEGFSDLSKDVLPKLIEKEIEFYGFPLPEDVYWQEVGNPERYRKAVEDVSEGRLKFRS